MIRICFLLESKVKAVSVDVFKAYVWEWSYNAWYSNIRRRWRWVVSLTPGLLNPIIHWMVGWIAESIWTFTREESLLFLPVIESRHSVNSVKKSIKETNLHIGL